MSYNNNEIHLILGGLPKEQHIIDYCNNNQNEQHLVVCINIKNIKTESENLVDVHTNINNETNRAILEIGDFNSCEFWSKIEEKYGGKVSKIIFDSSTYKFIKKSPIWDLEDNGLRILRNILTYNGEIYFDSLESSSISYSKTLFDDLQSTEKTSAQVTLLPLIQDNRCEIIVSVEEFRIGVSIQNFFGTSDFNSYMHKLEKIAQQNGFSVQIKKHFYPLENTTYPIENYLCLTRI